MAIIPMRIFFVDPEHAGLVAVKSHRLAKTLQIFTGDMEVTESRFARREIQIHDATGSIININEQCAGWATILKPAVVAAINLD